MAIYKDVPQVEVRERRLHSIIAYNGTGRDLYDKIQRVKDPEDSETLSLLAGKERSYSQCASCPESPASTIVARTRNTAVVYHSPIGCSANVIQYTTGIRGLALARKQEAFDVHTLSTHLQERDTIFGATDKLREALREAKRRFNPELIYIISSCASGIIGEDIETVTDELQEELGCPIAPVYCEGFKSMIWSSGFDAGYHGILRKVVKAPRKKQEDLVNLFCFEGCDTFSPLLARMGLRTNYLISMASRERLETISEAACSSSICETLSLYVASALEERYGVPEIKSPPPYGLDWTDTWLRAVGKATGREEAAERVIAEERAAYKAEIEGLREKLSGKRIFISAGDAFGHNLLNAARSLGLVLAGINSLHHDLITDNPQSVNSMDALVESAGDIPNFSICNIQPYQMIKLIKRSRPDLIITRHPGQNALGSKLGIPTLFEGDANHSMGYAGVVRLGRRLCEALRTRKLVDNIAAHVKFPYSDWWLGEEDIFYFLGGGK